MSSILIPEGFGIGHCNDDFTGVTCILCGNAVGGVSVRGAAPGTRETDLMRAEKSQTFINAVVLSGGSAYGLEASLGVMEFLKERGIGFTVGDKTVPLVAQAVLFDLNTPGAYHYPDKNMGYRAAQSACGGDVRFGAVGAGKGATVGKFMGMQHASKGGIGASTVESGSVYVTAVAAVNAVGNVYDHNTGKIIAGAKLNGNFISALDAAMLMQGMSAPNGANTTIGCVMTNAALDKLHANKLADIAHDGLALSIRPVHTEADGDTVFALSSGSVQADYNLVAMLAVEAMARAIEAAVK